MTRYLTSTAAATTAIGLAITGPAQAEFTIGKLTGEVSVELQTDSLHTSSNPANEMTDTYLTIGAGLSFAITNATSLNASLVIEPITGAVNDRFIEDHGLYVEELFFAHDFGPAAVVLGKFNPAFGAAWDVAPGLYGSGFAEDYELTEMVGGALAIPLQLAGGDHELTFAVFNADRSEFSQSLGRMRPQNNIAAGGVGNTDGPDSFTLSLTGGFGDLSYNIGAMQLSKGVGDVADQTGVVFGLGHTYGQGSAQDVELIAEVAWFDDFGGTRNSALYSTVGLAAPIGPATVSGVYATRDIQGARTDHLATLSAEMELTAGITGAVAYRWAREGADKNQTIGLLLAKEF